MTKSLAWLFARTLNSVWFGIAMMLLTATYVAVGSGLPRVREYFEMDELAFFNAWPLKVLMAVLVANLVTVTFLRIPFTLPRYGVWMIHAGIVTLIYGMAYYYTFKVEGLAFLPKGGSTDVFYDRWERSLFVRVPGFNFTDEHVLTRLPRFKDYDQRGLSERQGMLARSELGDIEPMLALPASSGMAGERFVPASRALGLKDRKVSLEVVGYWPYAEIRTNYVPVTASGETGVTGLQIEAVDAKGTSLVRDWLVNSDPQTSGAATYGDLEMEHRDAPDEAAARELAAGVKRIHTLEIQTPGPAGGAAEATTVSVDVGQTVTAGGYTIAVEDFDPAFPAMNGQIVQLITLRVTPPADSPMKGETFRRQVIMGREKVTDWKLGVAGSGPLGKRQDKPLDEGLVTRYTFNDSLRLLPRGGREKRVIVTAAGSGAMWVIATGTGRPARAEEIAADGPGTNAAAGNAAGRNAGDPNTVEMTFGRGEEQVTFRVVRRDNLRRLEDVVSVPPEKRNRAAGEEGVFQVAAVRVRVDGQSATTVLVPFSKWALSAPWRAGVVRIPGVEAPMQLQLGNRTRYIAQDLATQRPAQVTLDEFELVKYAGGSPMAGLQRDFKSHLTIREGNGHERKGVAHMNSPVYFGGTPVLGLGDSYWTLFQAQWDPQNQSFTVLGVGNRPGVWVMTAGCVLMTVGLLYAFYVKPLIIRRRKEAAIREAEARGVTVRRPTAVGA